MAINEISNGEDSNRQERIGQGSWWKKVLAVANIYYILGLEER